MKYGSVCSGIEAASKAWEPLGWKPAWFSEIEPFPSGVCQLVFPEPSPSPKKHGPFHDAAVFAGTFQNPDEFFLGMEFRDSLLHSETLNTHERIGAIEETKLDRTIENGLKILE